MKDTFTAFLEKKEQEEVEFKNKKVEVGKHDEIPDKFFDPDELKLGIKIEMEHTNNRKLAKAIAKDHLMELPDYYSRLTKMEKHHDED